MLNLNLFKKNPNFIRRKLKRRGFILDIIKINSMETLRKKVQIETETLQHSRNVLSKSMINFKFNDENFQKIKEQVIILNKELNEKRVQLNEIKLKILEFLNTVPNIPYDDVPIGKNDKDNQEIMSWGTIKKYNFLIKDHIELGIKLDGFDWKSAAKISGSRFIVMKNKIALLHRALGQFMLDIHTRKHGYSEVYVPFLVNLESLYGTGQLPKFNEDLFYIKKNSVHQNHVYALIPTAEVPLINLVKHQIIEEKKLPIMLTALTSCFRSETNSYGKDLRGLIRMHQFEKVEIIQIVHPNNSINALEQLTFHAETILRLLELPYRKVLLCTGDMSFSAAKTYDLEVWFPYQKKYREISSCSNMDDFQARRIKAKYYNHIENKKKWLHTINGSGLAIGRTLAAILENYQDSQGRIHIPKVLQKNYMNGLKWID